MTHASWDWSFAAASADVALGSGDACVLRALCCCSGGGVGVPLQCGSELWRRPSHREQWRRERRVGGVSRLRAAVGCARARGRHARQCAHGPQLVASAARRDATGGRPQVQEG